MSATDQAARIQADHRPLAERMRPVGLDEFVGQNHLVGAGKPLRAAIMNNKLHSMVLWGPPGTGKTTLARLIAASADAQIISLSAVGAGVAEIRDAVARSRLALERQGQRTILFVDEVHRFNKGQQDALLPYVENGSFVFIGATTENPSFEINGALLSRLRVYVLKALEQHHIRGVIDRALSDADRGLGGFGIDFPGEMRERIAAAADRDARRVLNVLEITMELAAATAGCTTVTADLVDEVLGAGVRRFDKYGDTFYDQISALHKSVRGSSPDAALYWLARMLDGGCDPLYIARRVARMASEDIGNADPRALTLALNAWDVQERLGSPEGELALAQVVVYLACAAKSNAVYTAFAEAQRDVQHFGSVEVPMHLRNAPTALMKKLGYAKGYRYAHDEPEGYAAGEDYFPREMGARRYYRPVRRGLEDKIADKLDHLRALDEKADGKKTDNDP